jgi:hypothetical protein
MTKDLSHGMVHLENADFLSNNASMTAAMLRDVIKNTSHVMKGYIKIDHQNFCLTFLKMCWKKSVQAYPKLIPTGKLNHKPDE